MKNFALVIASLAAVSAAQAAVTVAVNPGSTGLLSLTSVTGSGTQADPIIISENWTGLALDATIEIRGALSEFNQGIDPSDSPFGWGIWVQKRVTNNSGSEWTAFDNELQEILGTFSSDGDGLSFGQEFAAFRPFNSNLLPNVIEEVDDRDFVNFDSGIVPVGATLVMNFVITDNTPVDLFYLRQRPNFSIPAPGAAALLGLAGLVTSRRRRV